MKIVGPRLRRAIIAILFVTAAVFLILLQSSEPQSIGLQLVPLNSAALLILNELPATLPSLTNSRLYSWFEVVDPEGIEGLLHSERIHHGLAVFRTNIEQAYLIVHGIESKSNGAYRPHLTALIVPRPFRTHLLRDWFVDTVSKQFVAPVNKILEDGTHVVTGADEGQLFYIHSSPPYLIASNSRTGWPVIRRGLQGREGSLLDSPRFAELVEQVRPAPDLLLYVRGKTLQGLLPDFIYTASFQEGGLSEEYFEIQR